VYSNLLMASLSGRFELHRLNYKQVRAGSSSMSMTKTDEVDAKIIAQAGRRLQAYDQSAWADTKVVWDDSLQCLHLLIADYYRKSKEAVRLKNNISRLLKEPASIASEMIEDCRAELKFKQEQMKRIKLRIAKALECNLMAQLLMTIPGIGVLTAAALTARIGDIANFGNVNKLKGYLGLYPRRNQSGRSEGRSRMAKHGSQLVRHFIWNAAKSAAMHNPVCKAYFEAMKEKRKHAASAYGSVARKLIQQVYGVLETETPFKEEITA